MRRFAYLALLASASVIAACSSDPSTNTDPSLDDAGGDASTDAASDAASPDTSPPTDASTDAPGDAPTDAPTDTVPDGDATAPAPTGWSEDFSLPGVNGDATVGVHAMTLTPKRWLYVGGNFTHAGSVAAKNVAVWNGLKWLAVGEGLPGTVVSLAATPTEEVYAAVDVEGDYQLWFWNKTAWTNLGVNADDQIKSIDVAADGSLWVAGFFKKIGGADRDRLARYKDGTWSGAGTLGGWGLEVVRAVGSEVCVGGGAELDDIGVACWNGTTWTQRKSNLTRGSVKAIRADAAGNLVIGGQFWNTDDFEVPGSIARWNASTSKWELIGGGVTNEFGGPGNVSDVGIYGEKVYVTGYFVGAGGLAVRHAAMWDGKKWWDLDGGIAKAQGVGLISGPLADVIAMDEGGELYLGGLLSVAGGKNTMRVAHWNGTTWSAVDDPKATRLGINGAGNSVVEANDGTVYVGGNFRLLGGDVSAINIASLDATGWHSLGSGLNDAVVGLTWKPGTLYALGHFSGSGTTGIGDPIVAAKGIARWNGSTWSGVGGGLDGSGRVGAFAPDGKLWVGGEFEHAGTVASTGVAVWDGVKWSAVGTGVSGGWGPKVVAIAFHEGKVYVGGEFTKAGDVDAKNVAVWDGTTWAAVGDGFEDGVESLTVWNGKLVAGGPFKKSGETDVRHLAVWDGTKWTEIGGGLHPRGEWGSTHVTGLATHGTDLFITGLIERAGTVDVSHFARWNGTEWADLGGVNDVGEKLFMGKDSLWVAGAFTSAGGKGSIGVARYRFPAK